MITQRFVLGVFFNNSYIDLCSSTFQGLDALVALDIAKNLRVVSRALGLSVVSAQYQPSQEIFDLYDKVLVMDEGQCIYFGQVKEVVPHFQCR